MNRQEMAVDTTVLVASLVPQDSHHAKAESLMKGLGTGEVVFHCSTFAPAETCGVLTTKEFGTYKLRLPKEAVMVAWGSLSTWIRQGKIRVYPLTEERMALSSLIAICRALKGPDAVIVQTALELKLPLETYDNNMVKAWQRERRGG